ncbi:MAG: hypothetical protein RLZZ96_158 [Bacteroidota bacterium]|jgi:hypothetical protein
MSLSNALAWSLFILSLASLLTLNNQRNEKNRSIIHPCGKHFRMY